MKCLITIFLQLVLCSIAYSQEPSYKTLSTEDGLPSNTIHIVFADSKGYIWFGTPNGAVRWDSKSFKTYTIEDGLPNNEVFNFFEDSRGRLWLSTFSNELCYLKDKVIYTKRNDKRLAKFNPNFNSGIYEFNSHLFIHETDNNLVIDIDNFNVISKIDTNLFLLNFSEYNDTLIGHYWINDTLFYYIVSYNNSKYSAIKHYTNNLKKLDYKILRSILFNQNKLVYNKNNSAINALTKKIFYDSILDDKVKGKINFLKDSKYPLFQLKSALFVAKKELIILNNTNQISNLNKSNIYKFIDVKNQINYISERQIFNLNAQKGAYINPNFGSIYNSVKTITHGAVLATSHGVISVNTFNPTQIFLQFKNIHNFKHISYLSKHKMFIISTGGKIASHKNGKLEILKNFRSYCSYMDSKNTLWYSGLNQIFYKDNFIDNLNGEKEFILNPKSNVFVKDMVEDKYSNIFFTTNDGIYIYDRKNNIKYSISKSNFLSSNECSKLIIDNHDQSFWASTTMGVNHIGYSYHHDKLQFKLINRFLKDDGLPSDEINDILIKGDSVYVATPRGLSLITNKNYRPDTTPIPIHINEFKVNDSVFDYDTIFRLNSNQTNLEFDFSAIYYLRRNRLAIQYLLIRNGDTSQYNLTETNLSLNALKSGDYELIISAYDIDYPYNNGRSKSFKFTIDPPFYQTWWFYSLILLGLAGLAYIVYKRKLDRLRELSQYEKKISLLKLEALKAEMNPHFIFNCLSAIKDYVMQADIEKSQYYLNKLAKLIRLALYNSKDEFISLGEEIQFIDTYIELERMRFEDKFDFIKEFDLEQYSHFQIPTMILQPFIENAIRHGKIGQLDKQGKLFLNIYEQDEFLLFDIRDNGKGYEESQKLKATGADSHRSMAMNIIQERIAIYNRSYQLKIRYEIRSLENNDYKTQILVFIHLKNL